jgi:GDP-D-mannose dehydratase
MDWIEACFQSAGSDWRDHVLIESDFRSEYKRLVADPSIIRNLGWMPEVGFDDLARMMVGATAG